MKALVIGATGIIGNHVVRALLEEGISVRVFARGLTSNKNLEGLKVEKFKGDLYSARSLSRAVKGCKWVFHTAPYYPTHAFDLHYHAEMAMTGLDSVMAALSGHSIDRFIFTSSLTTIGTPPQKGQLADEGCFYQMKRPPHPYFAVKEMMENEVLLYARDGMPAVVVNPTGCFGPYELKPPSLCLVPQLVAGRIPGYVDQKINAVDVADVGRGHVLAAMKGKVGERYILGGHNTTSKALIEMICLLAGVSPPRLRLPLKVALSVAWVSEILSYYVLKRPPFFPILGLKFLQHGQHLDSSKAQKELGYRISPLEEALSRSIEWFRRVGYC